MPCDVTGSIRDSDSLSLGSNPGRAAVTNFDDKLLRFCRAAVHAVRVAYSRFKSESSNGRAVVSDTGSRSRRNLLHSGDGKLAS